MRRRPGIQREVLASLGLVMSLAALVPAVVLVGHQEASLRELLGRALWLEARRGAGAVGDAFVPGTLWFRVRADGGAEPLFALPAEIGEAERELAARAREAGAPLLQPGPFWGTIRFATPLDERGTVAVARIPGEVSRELRWSALRIAALVLLGDLLIFTGFGALLLRRRVVRPLQQLAAAARRLAAGEAAWVAPSGSREAAEVATAFNEMSESLGLRTEQLEKAVVELRAANRELRQTRDGLDRAERLAAVGRLAAGVAHEIGNPIGAILALMDLAGRDPTLGPEARVHLARGAREGERVRRILRQLLDFSRPVVRETPILVDLGQAARDAVELVRAQRRYGAITFDVVAEPDVAPVRTVPNVLTQILLNLLLNAADAVSARGPGGAVRLEVRNATLAMRRGDDGTRPAAERRVADAVECIVADDGPGIPEEHRERIFDPFFTTKPPGEGTGLGLANAQRACEELGAELGLTAPPDGFRTAFAVRLPRVEATGEARVAHRP